MTDKITASQELEEWTAKFKREQEEHIKQLNTIIKEAERKKDFVDIVKGKVTLSGTGAHISFPKRYDKHPVRVIVLKKKEGGNQT